MIPGSSITFHLHLGSIKKPGDYLFTKRDKPDWILQFLFHGLFYPGCGIIPIFTLGEYQDFIVLPSDCWIW